MTHATVVMEGTGKRPPVTPNATDSAMPSGVAPDSKTPTNNSHAHIAQSRQIATVEFSLPRVDEGGPTGADATLSTFTIGTTMRACSGRRKRLCTQLPSSSALRASSKMGGGSSDLVPAGLSAGDAVDGATDACTSFSGVEVGVAAMSIAIILAGERSCGKDIGPDCGGDDDVASAPLGSAPPTPSSGARSGDDIHTTRRRGRRGRTNNAC